MTLSKKLFGNFIIIFQSSFPLVRRFSNIPTSAMHNVGCYFTETLYYLMETKTRLDKAINGLAKIIARHDDFKNIKIDKDKILITNNKPELFWTILYLVIVLLIPTVLLLYEIINKRDFSFSLLIIPVFLFLFGRDLFKIIRGDTVLFINLKDQFLEVENVNRIFKRYFTKRKIFFNEISNVELIDKAVHSKYSATRWTEFTMFDKDKKRVILTNFSKKYPESVIAQNLKFLFDVFIWTEKQKLRCP